MMVRRVLVGGVCGVELLLGDVGEDRYGEIVGNGGENEDGSKEE